MGQCKLCGRVGGLGCDNPAHGTCEVDGDVCLHCVEQAEQGKEQEVVFIPLNSWEEYHAAQWVLDGMLRVKKMTGELTENDRKEFKLLLRRVNVWREEKTVVFY